MPCGMAYIKVYHFHFFLFFILFHYALSLVVFFYECHSSQAFFFSVVM